MQMPVARATDNPFPAPGVYWSDGSVERFDFLRAIEAELEKAGWDFKPDTGWTATDLEILTDNWTRLKLTTVSEELDRGRKNFRCRIERRWSLQAKIAFAVIAAAVATALVSFARVSPWVWMSLIAVPLIVWFFEENCQEYERSLCGVLDQAAVSRNLIKLGAASPNGAR